MNSLKNIGSCITILEKSHLSKIASLVILVYLQLYLIFRKSYFYEQVFQHLTS